MPKSLKQADDAKLSELEFKAMQKSADLAVLMRKIIGEGPNAYYDWLEATVHIHAIQNMILSQAAARSYPTQFRLLGGRLEQESEKNSPRHKE